MKTDDRAVVRLVRPRMRSAWWASTLLGALLLNGMQLPADAGCNPPADGAPVLSKFTVEELGVPTANKVEVNDTSNPGVLYVCPGATIQMDAVVTDPSKKNWIGWRIEQASGANKVLLPQSDTGKSWVSTAEGNVDQTGCSKTSQIHATEAHRSFYVKAFCDGEPHNCRKATDENYYEFLGRVVEVELRMKADLQGFDALRAAEDTMEPETDEVSPGVLITDNDDTSSPDPREAKIVVKGAGLSGLTREIDFGADYAKICLDGTPLSPQVKSVAGPSDADVSYEVTKNGTWGLCDSVTATLRIKDGTTLLCEDSITFVVLKVELDNPTANQEFHMSMSPPAMPTVPMKATVTPAVSGLEYRFEIGDPTTGRALAYEDAPSAGYAHPTTIDSGWVGSDTWNINFGTDLYGGHVTKVTVSLRKSGLVICSRLLNREFFILGDALTGSVRNGYINSLTTYPASVRTITRPVSVQESGGTHFWSGSGIGTATHTRYPLKEIAGPGGGYGVMQLTDASLLSISTIWNWQSNIDAAMARLQNCYNTEEAYLNAHPAGVTDEMKRLGAYNRYNGGLADRYYWWNGTQWVKFGYIPCPGGAGHSGHGATHGYRDNNNDGVADPAGNPYGIPSGPTGPNQCSARAARYADHCLTLE